MESSEVCVCLYAPFYVFIQNLYCLSKSIINFYFIYLSGVGILLTSEVLMGEVGSDK